MGNAGTIRLRLDFLNLPSRRYQEHVFRTWLFTYYTITYCREFMTKIGSLDITNLYFSVSDK